MPTGRDLQFESSYEAQAERSGVDINSRVDTSLRSFMDSGDTAFAGEIIDARSQKTREQAVADIRENIKRQLRQENAASVESADKQSRRHREYSGDLARDITKLERKQVEIEDDHRAYQELLQTGQNRGGAARFFTAYHARKKYRESNARSLQNDYAGMVQNVETKAERWQDIEDDYVKNVFRKHYTKYDEIAKTWYQLTREYERPSAAQGQAPGQGQAQIQPPQAPGQPQAVDRREIPADAAKDIAEYTGIYDQGGLQAVLRSVAIDPTLPVTGDIFVIKDYKDTRAGSANVADAATHVKKHRKMVMLSEADETTGLKKRYKFTRDFRGMLSKKQFTEDDRDTPTAVSFPQPQSFYQTVLAEDAGLEADEKDLKGRYLVSERNAEFLSAKVKRTGQRVHGFYLNGQFVTDEQVQQGDKASGKEDMSWWGRRSWDKQEKAEKLRAAIRKSAFFQHVNARTIQFYTSYQADDDYRTKISKVMTDSANAAGNGFNANASAYGLVMNPQTMDGISRAVLPQVLAIYAKERLNGNIVNAQIGNLSAADPQNDPVIAYALEKYGPDLSVAALYLLSDDTDPRLWSLARTIVIKNNATASRTRSKLNYLPGAGEAMRMALMEELAHHRQTGSEFDPENPLGILEIPGRRVYMEELNSRRGVGNWFKRNLLNGNIIKNVVTAAEVGVNAGANISDAIDLGGAEKAISDAGTDEEKKKKAEEKLDQVKKDIDGKAGDRGERHLWFDYGRTVSEFSSMASALSIVGVGATAAITAKEGGDVGNNVGVARDISSDVFSLSQLIGDVVKMVKGVCKLAKYLYNKFRSKTDAEKQSEEERKRRTLTDRDGSTLQAVLKFIDSALSFCSNARSIASSHVTAEGGTIAGASELWGGLLKSLGPVDMIITNLRRFVTIIDNIREIVASSRRIGRIDRADTDIETAIAAYKGMSAQQFEALKDQHESEVGFLFDEGGDRARYDKAVRAELGEAAVKNSQAQYFMSLTKAQSRKSRSAAGWNIGSNVLGGLKDLASLIPKSMGGSIIKAAAGVLPKLTEFIGWSIGKLKYDRQNFNDNIAMMLGDREYAGTPYFNEVLKRETGIVNKHYLIDLARIFMSIDTHSMLKNPNASGGELDLAKAVVGTLYGNVNDESVRTIKLSDMLRYAGVDASSDWRSLLRNSLMA